MKWWMSDFLGLTATIVLGAPYPKDLHYTPKMKMDVGALWKKSDRLGMTEGLIS